jgi:phosphoribosylaminoimidazolecarboxamide formyltransferase/IMP cyclohydrolase
LAYRKRVFITSPNPLLPTKRRIKGMEKGKGIRIQRVLISVSDKRGILQLASGLKELGTEILSTGGTARALQEKGIEVKEISEFTGFPEMLDGRVKTLHPKVHGGLLGRRTLPDHIEQMERHGIEPIDMVVINLYPFERTIAKDDCTLEEAIENIDIGGPAMIRSAAKNFEGVAVVVDPADYPSILKDLREGDGTISTETTFRLAKKAFLTTSRYDRAITEYLESQP